MTYKETFVSKKMNQLHALFVESLGIDHPFSLGNFDKQMLDEKTLSKTFTIEIDKDYRPGKFHTIHSYYEKSWQYLSMFQSLCYIKARLPVFMDALTQKQPY